MRITEMKNSSDQNSSGDLLSESTFNGQTREPHGPRLNELCATNRSGYRTLSYAWQDHRPFRVSERHIILCNGKPLRVSYNLSRALKRIRQYDAKSTAMLRPLPIWVDAVSIDQRNIEERDQQVLRIGDIYASSAGLIIWLGEGAPGSSCLSLVARQYLKSTIQAALESAWFKRRWIIQEFTLSCKDECRILFKDVAYEYNGFSHIMSYHDLAVKSGPMRHYSAKSTVPKDSTHAQIPKTCLLENLRRYHGALCQDPRDIVYSLLSLSYPLQDRGPFTIDYSKGAEQLFVELAHALVETDHLVEVLIAAIAHQSLAHTSAGTETMVPSWVPDWRQRATSKHMERAVSYHYHGCNCVPGGQRRRRPYKWSGSAPLTHRTVDNHLVLQEAWLITSDFRLVASPSGTSDSPTSCTGHYYQEDTLRALPNQSSWTTWPRLKSTQEYYCVIPEIGERLIFTIHLPDQFTRFVTSPESLYGAPVFRLANCFMTHEYNLSTAIVHKCYGSASCPGRRTGYVHVELPAGGVHLV